MPLATRFRVVSPPALISSRKKRSNSMSVSRSPSISAASSTVAMSSAGAPRFRRAQAGGVAQHLGRRGAAAPSGSPALCIRSVSS